MDKLIVALALVIIMADAYNARQAAERAETAVRSLQCPAPSAQRDGVIAQPRQRADRTLM